MQWYGDSKGTHSNTLKILNFRKVRRWDVNTLLIIHRFRACHHSVHVYCALNIGHPTTNISLSIRTVGLLCMIGSVLQNLCASPMHISLRSPSTLRFWRMHQSANALQPKWNDAKSFIRRKPTMWCQGVDASVRPAGLGAHGSLAPPPTMGRIVRSPKHACTVDHLTRPPSGCSQWLYSSHGGPQLLLIATDGESDKKNVFGKDLHP